jgi:ABC-type dipeptide/oligopeptide/nickel transport system permease component
MIRYLGSRAWQSALLLLLVTFVVFALLYIVPGDPVRLLLGDTASEDDLIRLREELGFNRPFFVQYFDFLGGLFQGDFGTSIRTQRPVTELIGQAIRPTLELTIAAALLAFGIGIPLGVLAANRPGSIFDRLAMFIALIGQSVPAFWLGLVLISVVALRLGWLPTSGYGGWQYLILPMLALAPTAMGMVLRVTRVSMIETNQQDFIRAAHAKGAHPQSVIWKHGFKNALIPVITIMGLQIGALLGGAVITETVFAWPGLGRLAVNALIQRDYPVVRAVVLLSALVFVIVNLLVDLAYALIDKRVRLT